MRAFYNLGDELVTPSRDRGALGDVFLEPRINLIPHNPFPGSEFRRSPRTRIIAFQKALIAAGYVATIRKTRGDDIDAACGQLAGQVLDKTRRAQRLANIPVVATV